MLVERTSDTLLEPLELGILVELSIVALEVNELNGLPIKLLREGILSQDGTPTLHELAFLFSLECEPV